MITPTCTTNNGDRNTGTKGRKAIEMTIYEASNTPKIQKAISLPAPPTC